ncbi:PspC domain-containing protein [Actinocrinis puniceicyclus]|uniref:PspC domain-containing protein n=1 Tax=Actinocrinis puniceicyclus TaxID=977794 RepID=A0A8J7WLJ4_9ACTN|nr:ATP-binding protein [Actinocrinis puniceicyclus]MBS2961710.1 PspC domain-containing protein [Actinocrinis puniceicyclus]
MTPPLPEGTRRLYRSSQRRLIGGIASGLSLHLGVDVWLLRLAFVLLALIDGAGLVAYAAFWLFVPLGRVPPADRAEPRPGARATLAIMVAAEAVIVAGMGAAGPPGKWNVILPVAAVVAGLGVLWRQADDEQRARWFSTGRRRPRLAMLVRSGVGALVVLGGITMMTSGGQPWQHAGRVLMAAFALVIGVVLIAMPFLLRVFRDLSAERAERIRSQERTEVAALMHDSVLHTLTLIQRSSGDSTEVARLARAQERELRAWLYEGGPRPRVGDEAAPRTFVQAVKAALAEVEDLHGIQIELVTVGDAPLDDRLHACVAAAREAAVNAAKYAKGAAISVYAEAETAGGRIRGAEVFVRDRGPGFDLDRVAADRMGIRESIVGRMKRHGGSASIRTAPGEGTEVRIEWRCD